MPKFIAHLLNTVSGSEHQDQQEKIDAEPLKTIEQLTDSFRARVNNLCQTIMEFDPYGPRIQKINYAKDLKDYLLKLAEITFTSFSSIPREKTTICQKMEKNLPAGSLTFQEAIKCMDENIRTQKFLDALALRLREMENLKEGQEFEMIDAGCGPIPIFALFAAIKSPNAKITCLEINLASVKIAEELIEKLGLQGRIKIIYSDAKTYHHKKPVDVFISETLYTGLTKEPFSQIFQNFVPQMSKDGSMIPEQVRVGLNILNRKPPQKIIYLKDVGITNIQITPNFVATLDKEHPLDKISMTIPLSELKDGDNDVIISSEVTLHSGEKIVITPLESTIGFAKKSADRSIVDIYKRTRDLYSAVKIEYTPGTYYEDIHPQWISHDLQSNS